MSVPQPPEYQLVETQQALNEVCARIRGEIELGMDTEADNQYHYRTRLCLIQLEVAGKIFLVDAEAPIDLRPFWEALKGRHLVMHGSDYDLRLMREHGDFKPDSIFDTMFAAQLCGINRVGLSSLLEQFFGLILDKDHQTANWSKRPMTREMLDYAAMDALHLRELRNLLHEKLAQLGRLEWMRQRCRSLIETTVIGFDKDTTHSWRITGGEKLKGHEQTVLYTLWHWREKEAERLDRPTFKVINNQQLVALARAAADGGAEPLLDKILSTRGGKRFRGLREAVAKGLKMNPEQLPRRVVQREDRSLSREEQEFLEAVKTRRDAIAVELGLDATLIATRSQLASLVRDEQALETQFLPWQASLIRPVVESLRPGRSTA